jgi:sulfur carrier protein ThiS adenylyltransferase
MSEEEVQQPAEEQPRSRFYRQEGLVPELIRDTPITVVGCGAIGRQVLLQLSAMGAGDLEFFDFDKVDESNRATQGYRHSQVGEPKVRAMLSDIDWGPPGDELPSTRPVEDRFRAAKWDARPVIFVCVDNMESRKAIWEGVWERVEFHVDGRMAGENIRILVGKPGDPTQYEESLFTDAEATPGRCTQQSTIYTANIAAGLMVHQFVRHLRGGFPDPDMLWSLADGSVVQVPREEGAVT